MSETVISFNPGDLIPFLPELVLVGGLLILLIVDLIIHRNKGNTIAAAGGILLVVLTIIALTGNEKIGAYLFNAVVQDGVTLFFRVFFAISALIAIGIMVSSFKKEGEPFILVLSSVLGMFLLAGSNDLVTLFVAIEMVSIPSYVLAGYKRKDPRSGEAALKYVIFGAFSSGLLLYGFSLLYGLTGNTGLPEMAAELTKLSSGSPAQIVGLILVLAGIGYKIAMVPMHFWCPDVYEGSPTPITAFFSVLPKAAGFAALFRLMPLFATLKPAYGLSGVGLITMVSALTMTFGNLGAIWQDSVKRLLAYSSIAHAGYILMGFAVIVSMPEGELYNLAVTAVLFYLVVYMFMNLGAFLVVDWVERHLGGDSIGYFKGLGKGNPLPALALAVFLFSLTGLPPLAGFIGKFYLFAAVVKAKMWALAMIGIANAVVSLFYYVRIIRDMYLHDPSPEFDNSEAPLKLGKLTAVLTLVTVVPTVILGIWWGPLAEWIKLRIF
ncbi:MAG: NADH-quinone oxidoreductase subunit N [Candidatus Hatepunaea meridiana]|nr:NADH-quinone oxidoreductase subunit N [Candidatus Hatepunaea meridiana]